MYLHILSSEEGKRFTSQNIVLSLDYYMMDKTEKPSNPKKYFSDTTSIHDFYKCLSKKRNTTVKPLFNELQGD
jgi:hypothetical protein